MLRTWIVGILPDCAFCGIFVACGTTVVLVDVKVNLGILVVDGKTGVPSFEGGIETPAKTVVVELCCNLPGAGLTSRGGPG